MGECWQERPEIIKAYVQDYYKHRDHEYALDAIEQLGVKIKVPVQEIESQDQDIQYQEMTVKEIKREAWKKQEQELLRIQEQEAMGRSIAIEDRTMLEEGRKYIELESKEETRKRIEKKRQEVQQERMVELEYYKKKAQEAIYARVNNGEVSQDYADVVLGQIDSMNSYSTQHSAYEKLASLEDKQQSVESVVEDVEQVLEKYEKERVQELNDEERYYEGQEQEQEYEYE